MVMCNSSYIFQENISEVFEGFYTVCVYIENIFIITKDSFEDHVKALGKLLQKLDRLGLTVIGDRILRQTRCYDDLYGLK